MRDTLVAAFLLCGCAASEVAPEPEPVYAGVFLHYFEAPPAPGHVDGESLTVLEDTAAAFSARPRSRTSANFPLDVPFWLTSRDPAVIELTAGIEDAHWVAFGAAPGSTCLEVVLEGEVMECLPAQTLVAP